MEKTINQIKSDLNEIATEHRQINSFFFGSFNDAISRDAIDYTLMTALIQPGTIGEGFVDINLQIIICDKYNEGNFRQIDEIHSDSLQILNDIFITMKQNKFDDYLDINSDMSTEPFIHEGQDITAGWSGILSLRVYDNSNWCGIPYDSYDFEN
jgi:hypothetical protein